MGQRNGESFEAVMTKMGLGNKPTLPTVKSDKKGMTKEQRFEAAYQDHMGVLGTALAKLKSAPYKSAINSVQVLAEVERLQSEIKRLADKNSLEYAMLMNSIEDDMRWEQRENDAADRDLVNAATASFKAAQEAAREAAQEAVDNAIVDIPYSSRNDADLQPGFVRVSDLTRIAGRLLNGEGVINPDTGWNSISFTPAGTKATYQAAILPSGRMAFFAQNLDVSDPGSEGSSISFGDSNGDSDGTS